MARAYRPRRSCLAVPGSSRRFIDKARGLPCDEVFLDLEDAVAPAAKAAARGNVIEALNRGTGAASCARSGSTTPAPPWAYRDVIEVVEGAAANLDVIVLPKVTGPDARQLARPAAHPAGARARPAGRPDRHRGADRGRRGLAAVDAIAAASPPAGGAGLRPGRLHGQPGHALAGGGGPARRVRGRRLPLPADADPGRGARPRAAGHRRPVRQDRRPGRPGPGRGQRGRARLRRQVGDPPGQIDTVNQAFTPGPANTSGPS